MRQVLGVASIDPSSTARAWSAHRRARRTTLPIRRSSLCAGTATSTRHPARRSSAGTRSTNDAPLPQVVWTPGLRRGGRG